MSANTQFVMLGPPGSGKGTQAKVLAEILKVPHISTGDIFRDNILNKTELGKTVDNILQQGLLVPDNITNEIVSARLKEPDVKNGFVLDGFPRNLVQANFLDKLAREVKAINLELPDNEAVRRISRRRTCVKCGAIYHLDFKPPLKSGVCDIDGGELIQRNDQTENVVRDRLAIYHKQTEPLLEYYKSEGDLITIDGTPPISQVTDKIKSVLRI